MKELYFGRDLGMDPFVPQRKEWILSALGAGVSFWGALKSADKANAAEARQRALEAKQDAYYNRRYNEDYVDTKAGQALITRAKNIYKSGIKRAQGAQAVAGGTDAATQMAKDSANKGVADTIANLGVLDTQRKERADAQNQAAQARFAQMDMQRDMQRAQNISEAAGAASNAIGQMGSAFESSTNLQGGNNKGTTAVSSDGGNGPTVKIGDSNISVGKTGNSYTDQMSRMEDILDAYDKANATNLTH